MLCFCLNPMTAIFDSLDDALQNNNISSVSGNIPLKIVSRDTSSAMPLMTYTLIPTGGVITPISVTNTIITPNHIGSKPKDITSG